VRGHVDRHALEPGLEVGAVVEVDANEALVRLAVAGLLRDDEARHRLEQLAFAREWAKAEIGGADTPLGSGRRDAGQIIGVLLMSLHFPDVRGRSHEPLKAAQSTAQTG
jgi:hypothetical protein